MDKKDVKVEFKDGVLTVEGKQEGVEEDKKGRYFTRERCSGDFSRSFRIRSHYDARKVEAVFKHGILTLTVPKSEESKPVTVKVQ